MSLLQSLALTEEAFKKQISAAKVLVVGDVMLDRYWFGDTHRISPEAPVPVAKIEKIEQRAGGAANVARNIASLGGQVGLLAITGTDEAADSLAKMMSDIGVAYHGIQDAKVATTIKLRVMARNQQLIRLDFEDFPQEAALQELLEQFKVLQNEYDAIILSDYGKGCLKYIQQLIDLAGEQNKLVLIDPKGSDYQKYEGATMITPNRAELKQVVGQWVDEDDLENKVQMLRQKLALNAVLLTRSEEGMSLYGHQNVHHQPTHAQEVYDVSGAGDTVIASMALCLAAGFSAEEAMTFANIAAGVVVAKLGTAVCTQQELLDAE